MASRLPFIAAVVAGIAQPASVAAAPPPLLARTDKWLVNYDADSCTLASIFGEGDDRMIARLTWFGPEDTFQLILTGKRVTSSGTSGTVYVTFGPAGEDMRATTALGTSGTSPMLVVTNLRVSGRDSGKDGSEPPAVTAQQEAAIEWADIRIAGGRLRRLDLKNFGKALSAIHTCQRNLVEGWGLDPAVQASLSRKVTPLTLPGKWLASSDYPMLALQQGLNGIVRFRLDVGETGAITGCHVQTAMKPADFDTITCNLIRSRARLLPALDKDGKPVPSYYISSVRWIAG